MLQVQFLAKERVGQLSGSTNTTIDSNHPRPWPLLVDWQGWPLLQDTGKWGAQGFDLGPNVEHSDGRLYFFFCDAVCFGTGNRLNTDLVAWTDEIKVLRKGGHLAQGWNFYLPNDHEGATDATGQKDWRFCDKCHGLFWAQGGNPVGSACPKDGGNHHPIGWNFYLTNDHQGATDATGQKDWRFCDKCHGLFWNGDGIQGVCHGSPGGGIVLHPVLNKPGGCSIRLWLKSQSGSRSATRPSTVHLATMDAFMCSLALPTSIGASSMSRPARAIRLQAPIL